MSIINLIRKERKYIRNFYLTFYFYHFNDDDNIRFGNSRLSKWKKFDWLENSIVLEQNLKAKSKLQ